MPLKVTMAVRDIEAEAMIESMLNGVQVDSWEEAFRPQGNHGIDVIVDGFVDLKLPVTDKAEELFETMFNDDNGVLVFLHPGSMFKCQLKADTDVKLVVPEKDKSWFDTIPVERTFRVKLEENAYRDFDLTSGVFFTRYEVNKYNLARTIQALLTAGFLVPFEDGRLDVFKYISDPQN